MMKRDRIPFLFQFQSFWIFKFKPILLIPVGFPPLDLARGGIRSLSRRFGILIENIIKRPPVIICFGPGQKPDEKRGEKDDTEPGVETKVKFHIVYE